ncbi:bifunctional ADP-dependent NAD(P)H-hydrate dehydratase/NAD(P)H-hydrate epimerase [Rhodococcus triatomae]|uniref:Bifunctional NAD(P)H-hydrate repair enzyme n=1 Tax=Rhodococcus triatomae TaxID=300028 RepID=A0A1G8R5K7_9NOCA|nr:bifunctional ADP-dependent NAD(P)H-hydrate dehydratase/NAD(P)H-hydrate epimerase [Rhodococcus triatomae]QNG19579.1 bifunctional ADP-dependent NAD(P)H-hydrate dehydratase/NAD(P)H-hydrate epimerase [Rhodococcus triatomae]QNG24506.1 bifunctional ADP-dependent NAD(P)H-hydrate dehydratase/NAD(P)H-hydrate epimerase [Rhodococcus triatomae]SDJ12218.1 yjeF C-terminal region, hydroxyethylthiazole kinase-related/yjeF N-terminal region [Rhodococcus triatomae]
MRPYYTAEQVRDAEAPLLEALPDGALMRRAAHGLARVIAAELHERTGGVAARSVLLLVGSGDNGGDALWAGALLRRRGVAVTAVLLAPDRTHPAGSAALRRAGGRAVDVAEVDAALLDRVRPDLAVDGIVGISGQGPLRPAAAELVAALSVPIVAVDLPSGVDPDTGAVDGPAVQAAVTVTFGARKRVHVLAAPRCGRVDLVPLGLSLGPADLVTLDASEVGQWWPVPGPGDDKYSQGVVGVVAGSDGYPGAGVLCTGAAVTATSGLVRYAGPSRAEVLARWPEVIATPEVASAGRVQAWVVGPGAGTDDAAEDVLAEVLSSEVPVLVDADGLTVVARRPDLVTGRAAPTVLTPHAGEFERLTGTAPGPDRVGAVRALAREWGVTLLLKGRATIIADPAGQTFVNEAGGSWSSTAGAGDVLSGVVGALLAAGIPPARAAAMGARVHSLAANLAAHGGMSGVTDGAGRAPISAGDLLSHLREAVRVVRATR